MGGCFWRFDDSWSWSLGAVAVGNTCFEFEILINKPQGRGVAPPPGAFISLCVQRNEAKKDARTPCPSGPLHSTALCSEEKNSPLAQTFFFEFLQSSVTFRLRHTGAVPGFCDANHCGFIVRKYPGQPRIYYSPSICREISLSNGRLISLSGVLGKNLVRRIASGRASSPLSSIICSLIACNDSVL